MKLIVRSTSDPAKDKARLITRLETLLEYLRREYVTVGEFSVQSDTVIQNMRTDGVNSTELKWNARITAFRRRPIQFEA